MKASLLLATLLWTGANAQNVGVKSKLGFACFSAGLAYNFSCPAEHLPFVCHCASDDYLSTVLNCIARNAASESELLPAYYYVQCQCAKWGARKMSYLELQELYDHGTGKLIKAEDTKSWIPNNGTVLVADDLYQHELKAAYDMKAAYNIGNYFGYAIIGFWAFIFIMASIKNGIDSFYPRLKLAFGPGPTNWLRGTITVPTLYGKKHQVPYKVLKFYDVLLPTRWESVIVVAFVILNILSLTVRLDLKDNSPLVFTDNVDKCLRYIANRTGIMAIVYSPIVVLMACRNNPFIRLTGWSYPTMQLFHRWNARAMFVHTVIHGVVISIFSYREKALEFKWLYVFNWQAGNTALYAMTIMIVFALRPIRQRIYEIFLIIHQAFFIAFLVGVAVHCSDYGWMGYIYSAIVIYGLEYFSRILNIIQSGGISKGRFTQVSDDMFKVRVYGRHLWQIRHGNYAYLRILKKDIVWQSHPFSVFRAYKGHELETIDFMVKVRNGATKSIMDHLKHSPCLEDDFKVIVEGPYGHVRNLKPFKSLLLLAGGVGITAMYSYVSTLSEQRLTLIWVVQDDASLRAFEEEIDYLHDLQNIANILVYITRPCEDSLASPRCDMLSPGGIKGDSQSNYHEKSTTCIREFSTASSMHTNSEFGLPGSTTHLAPTSADKRLNQSSDACSQSTACRNSLSPSSNLTELRLSNLVRAGRPDLSNHVATWIEASTGPMAVFSCGPCNFVDSSRSSIVDHIKGSTQSVSYYEEAFNW